MAGLPMRLRLGVSRFNLVPREESSGFLGSWVTPVPNYIVSFPLTPLKDAFLTFPDLSPHFFSSK